MSVISLDGILDELAADAARSGAAADVFDIYAYRRVLDFNPGALPDGVVIRHARTHGPARWVFRRDSSARSRILYLHGGGLVAGGWGSHRCLVAWLARRVDAAVLFPEFRLAPEHPYPAGLEDALAAYRHLRENGPEDSDAPARVFVVGDSSGAALALALCFRLRAQTLPAPDGVLMLCPMLSFSSRTSRYVRDTLVGQELARAYCGVADPDDPLISPLHGALAALPPIYVQAGGADKFLPDTQDFAARATAQGASLQVAVWEGMPHVWQRFAPRFAPSVEALAELADVIESWPSAAPRAVSFANRRPA